ncbi:ankyrin repeat and zinc finger domain-containing protein 1-like [Sitophilus oryzae]|uniref:Ankyrin repeat and zinc finger domain-containing protein 1-like n=1 Tax=Sitophilus oryzae TaxID=7048 RepID=A0A6J2XKG4_SITOR|nr:ankyrin repeat and zinc finger domain-containing protein 1-like [Sitophilus oryzae]XP_030751998.1 ankyrin repeat and zinc finger domain-containing protein 1-like [Sitophilus oryzae]
MSKREIINEVVFNETFYQAFDENVKPVLLDGILEKVTDTKDDLEKKQTNWSSKNNLSCSYCQTDFSNVQQQREHYRLDWHRYNLKQSIQSRAPVSEEEFLNKTENDDVSSISGSDTEEEDSLDTYATAQGKIFLQNKKGQVFSLYRGLFLDKKGELSNVDFYKQYIQNCADNKKWAVLMLGGGHFAGAIFDYLTPVVHKTFHCYTVRAGQGGSQSSRDSKSGGSHPKSAGASLRRYNEQALVDHVRSIMELWTEEIKNCSLIFYRASGPYNRSVLFGGKDPILDRNDPRLRTIPFSTGRATFKEVKRVHLELVSGVIYETLDEAASLFAKQRSPEKETKRNKVRSSCINRAKSREIIQRPLPGDTGNSSSEENISNVNYARLESENLEDAGENDNLVSDVLEVSFDDLKEYADSLTPEERRNHQNKRKPKKSKNQKLREKEEARKKNLVDILTKGNVILMKELFEERLKTFQDIPNMPESDLAKEFFNSEVLDDKGNGFLHIAALNEHDEMIQYLLENNADPCAKNKNQQTPYSCTKSKTVREVFRKFAKENPDKYDYNKAQIPLNVLTDQEIAEKKKAQRKVKKDKEKEKKKENYIKQKEYEETNRFLNLSDREKRALAAERRILNAHGKVISRCFLCGSDMAGRTPFEYLENRFCSIECLKSHRLKIH